MTRAGGQAIAQQLENRLGRAVEIAVEMDEGDRPGLSASHGGKLASK